MRLRLSKPIWHAVRHRLVAGVTLLAYLAVAIGFPLPAADANSPTSTGASAGCCCGTAVQCQASGCGCSHQPEPEPVCCAKKNKSTESRETNTKKSKGDSVRWVIAMSAKKCGGGLSDWIQADVALPAATHLTWQPSWPYCHSLSVTQEFSLLHSSVPLDPPPRADA